MALTEIFALGTILLFAGMLQSAIGFGYALFATPLILMYGLSLPAVITLVVTCSFCQSLTGLHSLRKEVPWKNVFIATVIRLLGLLVGLVLLDVLVDLKQENVQMVVGGILSAIIIVQLQIRPKPHKDLHRGWGILAIIGSGLLSGLCGMGGPPLVLWSMAQPWESRKIRAFLFGVFACSLPLQLLLLGHRFGVELLDFSLRGFMMYPFVWLGSMIGLRVGNRIEKSRLKLLAYGTLLLVGLISIVPPLAKLVFN